MEKFSCYILDLYSIRDLTSIHQVRSVAIEKLKGLIRFDFAIFAVGVWQRNVPLSQLADLYLHGVPHEFVSSWMGCQDEDVFIRQMTSQPNIAHVCDVAKSFNSLSSIGRHCSRFNFEHVLGTCSLDNNGLAKYLCLYRSAEDAFDEKDRRYKELVFPHLVQLERMVYQNMSPVPHNHMSGCGIYAICNWEGVIQFSVGELSHCIKQEWPFWSGPVVPEEIRIAILGSRDIVNCEKIIIEIIRGEEGVFLLPRIKTQLDSLTVREKEIADYYSSGLTYKEIAQIVKLSPLTVRTYISKIYLKLGCKSRVDLLGRLNVM